MQLCQFSLHSFLATKNLPLNLVLKKRKFLESFKNILIQYIVLKVESYLIRTMNHKYTLHYRSMYVPSYSLVLIGTYLYFSIIFHLSGRIEKKISTGNLEVNTLKQHQLYLKLLVSAPLISTCIALSYM